MKVEELNVLSDNTVEKVHNALLDAIRETADALGEERFKSDLYCELQKMDIRFQLKYFANERKKISDTENINDYI